MLKRFDVFQNGAISRQGLASSLQSFAKLVRIIVRAPDDGQYISNFSRGGLGNSGQTIVPLSSPR